MKPAALVLVLILNAAAATDTNHFRFMRSVLNTPQAPSQTCVVLDAPIFAHAAAGLADVRLFDGTAETPYAIRTAASVQETQSSPAPLNLGTRNGKTSFDLAMPPGTYSDLELNLTAKNFIASVTVWGSQSQDAREQTRLGSFTIFDLSGQKLGRSTVLHLPPSDFRYLHLSVAGPMKPEEIESASLVRAPVPQTLYVSVAETSEVKQQGRSSVMKFTVPANVPVDRVLFVPADEPSNFTRDVTVMVKPTVASPLRDESAPPRAVSFSGNLLRLHRKENGQQIDEERMAVEAAYYQAFAEPTEWVISVENGDDPPVQLRTVGLEMRQRELCFEATAGGSYSLFYGDPSLQSPQYDYARLFALQKSPARATAGPERPNSQYEPRPDDRPFTERHPVLLWMALLLTMFGLGVIAMRSVSSTRQAK